MSASIVSFLPNEVVVGQTVPFQVCTTATPPEQGQLVNVYILLSNPAQRTQFSLQYFDTTSGTFQPINFNSSGVAIFGPGPPAGFPLENACSTFRITFNTPGTYGFTLQIRRASDGAVWASTTQTVSAVELLSFSTGPILNSGSVPSTTLKILISNDDEIATATVELEVFEVPINTLGTAKVGAVHQLFTIPPLTVATHTANITGFPAYEVQANVTGNNVIVNTFESDVAGNLNATGRVLQSETTPNSVLSPLT